MKDSYDFKVVEEEIFNFWNENEVYAKLKARNKGKKSYYFLDGPPYTSGRVHLGTAWNKVLKDSVLRFRRMRGYDVWDRAGYDMHGLPTENATQKKFGIKNKDEIEKFGVKKFIDECKITCIENMKVMNKDFQKLGVWMDFDNAYQTASKDFMNGVWWLIKKAHEKKRLYEGLRTMTWCAHSESALAKHELEYKTVVDNSIFVKFKLKNDKNEFLVIWTTTPWTIPFNLAVMVGPEIEYVKAKVGDETWIVAAPLAGIFINSVADKEFKVLETFKGEKLEGAEYEHPFYNELSSIYDEIKAESPKTHTVLLSSEYVDTSAGSGLVHCAPGCGPEDYEIGYKNGIPAFNNIDTKGVFPSNMGQFTGLTAKKDDKKFIEALENCGALIAQTEVEHEYPHDWRHHEPVIFRTTKQWFFKIEDLKEKMIQENNKISWVPKAAFNAYDSWLKNLRDNSISKQRYWGTPLPVWRNIEDEEDYLVIGSSDELEKLSGKKVDDLHISVVDHIEIKKDGKTYKRIPDVLDVWVDAGTTSWNCLDFPKKEEHFKNLFPADFILEGKDQIRGWFNLLMITSMVSMDVPSFSKVYMHGFINDYLGRKMSKSIGNQTSPYEVTDKFGVDSLRYYTIAAAKPGLDMNYNPEETEIKFRNLFVLWNMQHLLTDIATNVGQNPSTPNYKDLDLEDKFIISKLHSAMKKLTEKYENYELNETPIVCEDFFLTLSRSYIKLVREKSVLGTDKQKKNILDVFFECYFKALVIFSPTAPYITDKIYQNLKSKFGLEKTSIHEYEWPEFDKKLIDNKLEEEFFVAEKVIGAILSCRDQANVGTRWPLQKVIIDTKKFELKDSIERVEELIKSQVNVKEILLEEVKVSYNVKPNFKSLGKKFGTETGIVAELIKERAEEIATKIEEKNINIEGFEITKDDLELEMVPPENFKMSIVSGISSTKLFLDTVVTEDLETEGFVREIIRRTQQLRKDSDLKKEDRINLNIETDLKIKSFADEIKSKVGADEVNIDSKTTKLEFSKEEKIRGKIVTINIQKK